MNTLIAVLRNPDCARELSSSQWEALLGEGRRTRMLARLHHLLAHKVPDLDLPVAVRDMLSGHARYVAHMHVLVRSELRSLGKLAAQVEYPVILLKGAAYLMAELPFAAGRGLSDIDVLVPRHALPDFEQRLRDVGWEFDPKLTAYDNQYYRQWSHELPPMRHSDCSLELDVHHNLIQVTSRSALDVAPVIERSERVAGTPFYVLAPTDRVLHSALHLMMSDELRGGIRDLYDIHVACLYGAERDANFWPDLLAHGRALGLLRPLYYCLSLAEDLFGLEPPDIVWRTVLAARPAYPVDRLMSTLMRWHLVPQVDQPWRVAAAEQLLYLRSHWVRMPPGLLLRHLVHKSGLWVRGGSTPSGDALSAR
tara:strand:+ start:6496 stop:7593 length:1098 start_codon:yes stop_codon:yes gene_type:complete